MILRQYPSLGQVEELLRDQQVMKVIIGLSEPGLALSLIEQLHNSYPEAVVAAAHTYPHTRSLSRLLDDNRFLECADEVAIVTHRALLQRLLSEEKK